MIAIDLHDDFDQSNTLIMFNDHSIMIYISLGDFRNRNGFQIANRKKVTQGVTNGETKHSDRFDWLKS